MAKSALRLEFVFGNRINETIAFLRQDRMSVFDSHHVLSDSYVRDRASETILVDRRTNRVISFEQNSHLFSKLTKVWLYRSCGRRHGALFVTAGHCRERIPGQRPQNRQDRRIIAA